MHLHPFHRNEDKTRKERKTAQKFFWFFLRFYGTRFYIYQGIRIISLQSAALDTLISLPYDTSDFVDQMKNLHISSYPSSIILKRKSIGRQFNENIADFSRVCSLVDSRIRRDLSFLMVICQVPQSRNIDWCSRARNVSLGGGKKSCR